MAELAEQYEEISEQLDINKLHLTDNKRKNLEQRAKISLVNGVIPLIDRMLHEIERLKKGGESETVKAERYTYIRELTDKINELKRCTHRVDPTQTRTTVATHRELPCATGVRYREERTYGFPHERY